MAAIGKVSVGFIFLITLLLKKKAKEDKRNSDHPVHYTENKYQEILGCSLKNPHCV